VPDQKVALEQTQACVWFVLACSEVEGHACSVRGHCGLPARVATSQPCTSSIPRSSLVGCHLQQHVQRIPWLMPAGLVWSINSTHCARGPSC
jgi:hypothetical protein